MAVVWVSPVSGPVVSWITDSIPQFRREAAVICAADDQWNDEGPRLCVTHINGTKILTLLTCALTVVGQRLTSDRVLQVTGSCPPPQVLNATRGILALNPGDYAIVYMQFRVGDGQEISRDWEALCRMRSFRLPAVAPWDGQSPASHELGATALLLSPPRPIGIRAFFDQDATLAYYREILEEGQRAFIESHYGVEQARTGRRMGADVRGRIRECKEDVEALQGAEPARICGDGYARPIHAVGKR